MFNILCVKGYIQESENIEKIKFFVSVCLSFFHSKARTLLDNPQWLSVCAMHAYLQWYHKQ